MTGRAPGSGAVFGALVGRITGWRRARFLARHHARTGAQARTAIADRIRAGDHVGAAPYGYRIAVDSSTPRQGVRQRRTLIVDEVTAPVVVQIFTWRATNRIGATVIARRLDADLDRYPPPTDANGARRRWTRGVVRHVLAKLVYTGRRVWGRTCDGRSTPGDEWVASERYAHPALVDDLTFRAAQRALGPTRSGRG